MGSRKHRTISRSGSSPASKTKPSRRTSSSSPTAPASFEETFGRTESPALQRARAQLELARTRLESARSAEPLPTAPALFRSRHKAKVARIERHIRELHEVIQHLSQKGTANAD